MDANNTTNTKRHYTPAMLDQIRNALRKYAAINNIRPEKYHLVIKATLGLKDSDNRLHSNDPRHWYNGHIPNGVKLDLFADFVSKVFPDLKFFQSRTASYIETGLILSRFSIGDDGMSDAKLRKKAKKLHGECYTSGIFKPGAKPEDERIFSMLSFRWITTTPYLLLYKFSFRVPPYLHPEGSDKDEFIGSMEFYSKILKEIPERDGFYLDNVQKGIVVPMIDGTGYHGILQTNDYLPNHVQLIAWERERVQTIDIDSRGFTYKGLNEPETDLIGHKYHLCEPMPQFEALIAEMGEPVL